MKVLALYGDSTSEDLTVDEVLEQWKCLEEIPGVELKLRYYSKFPSPEEFNSLVDEDTEALLGVWIMKDFLNRDFYDRHPRLKYIAGLAHGYQQLDWELSRSRGIVITNTTYGEHTIAEYTMALLLEICKRTEKSCRYVRNREWEKCEGRSYMYAPSKQIELYGKTFGLIGLGKIGYNTARLAHAFGMKVLAYNRTAKTGPDYDFIEQCPLDRVLEQSDIISLHIALNSGTHHFINGDAVARMKDGVIIINTGRGALIDEAALVAGLKSGKIYGAGLDVMEQEPPAEGNPLLNCENALITPHIAWLPKTCRIRQISMAVDNFLAYLGGNPESVINGK